ncbi:uncharacterized protein LOC123676225 [Harmonia axyridis]|uniref:uncharacterized protein LOC123676225 n=1 Tax=Harmonia axyridis TaxID=115357 RepID=UPI001E277A17|nr:uncharacterized protein LOC123676225 [Harmonia axyridis]
MNDRDAIVLSSIKESVAPSDSDGSPDIQNIQYYPFARVLQLRVLQIVCGISFLIIGTVAFIVEKGKMNLGLGIPTGGATILAAAASIHTTRGFGGYRTSAFNPGSLLRLLGPSVKVAVPLTLLWAVACSFMGLLLFKSIKVISCWKSNQQCVVDTYSVEDDELSDLLILAILQLTLTLLTFIAVFSLLRIDWKYDPD